MSPTFLQTGATSEYNLYRYLNLWTAPQKGEAKKAVMLFVYGGGFETGTTAGTDGSRLVVVKTL
jgi:carboxylesterase type B